MTYTTRYIVYNDPPTLEQLRTWQQDDSSTLQWSFHEAQVVASQLAALPQRQCPSPPPFDPRFEDAESPLEDFNFQSGKVKLVKRALHQPDFGDESDASLPSARSKSRRISHGDGDDSRTEGDTTANVTTCSCKLSCRRSLPVGHSLHFVATRRVQPSSHLQARDYPLASSTHHSLRDLPSRSTPRATAATKRTTLLASQSVLRQPSTGTLGRSYPSTNSTTSSRPSDQKRTAVK